jgi:hypothetical protein
MAAFSSQAGQVILRTQAVQGTFQADTSTAGVGIKLRSGSLGPNRDLLIPDPEIGGGRDVVDANLGAVSWSGDYEFYLRMNSFLTLLYAAMGIKAAPVTASRLTPSPLRTRRPCRTCPSKRRSVRRWRRTTTQMRSSTPCTSRPRPTAI